MIFDIVGCYRAARHLFTLPSEPISGGLTEKPGDPGKLGDTRPERQNSFTWIRALWLVLQDQR